MPNVNIFDVFENEKTVDFDRFDLDTGFNYEPAKELCWILMSYQNIDELTFFEHVDEFKYETSIGTGGSGSTYKVQTLAQQRSLLASHFASYASKEFTSCSLSLAEYNCLKDMLEYMIDDICVPNHRKKIVEQQIDLLKKVCSEFEKIYVKKDPSFLFTMLKNN
jgi:hypothetical protein